MDEERFVNDPADLPSEHDLWLEEQGIEWEPLEEAIGKDLQATLEVAYARYMLVTTRNLIGHLYGGSPLIRHKRDVPWRKA